MSGASTEFSTETDAAYQLAIRALYDRINYEKIGHPTYSDANYRLDRMRHLLARLGDPHLAAPVIHIAGTKGKGSTATFIARMLSAAGYRTGLYTSPHLLRLEERFQIDHQNCSPAAFVALVELARSAAEQVEAAGLGRATFFELTTALAFLYFAQQRAEAVVLEVGLGGRLDSTNVCQPSITIITSIGLDHQAQLGYTIAAIAGEKAGIIKPRIPVISSARHADARQVITAAAERLDAPLRLIGHDFDCQWQALPDSGSALPQGPAARPAHPDQAVSPSQPAHPSSVALQRPHAARCAFLPNYAPSHLGQSTWPLAVLGAHQGDNLAAALATVDALAEMGWQLPRDRLAAAIGGTVVPARLEPVGHQPRRLIDSAHNPDSIAATLNALDVHFPGQPLTIVLATSRDKDADAMLRLIIGRCQRLILTQYQSNPRGLPVAELLVAAERISQLASAADGQPPHGPAHGPTQLFTADTPAAAWQLASKLASPNEVICATGSFFQAAELMAQ